MPTLTEQTKPKGLKLIHYGESGSGKTVRASQFAKFGRVYFFDFDNKIDNLQAFLQSKNPDLLPNISYDVYRGSDKEVVEAVNTKLEEIAASIAAGKPLYETIVLDSWTQFERNYFNYLLSRFSGLGGKNWGEARQTVQVSPKDTIILPGTLDHQLKNRAFPEFIDKLTSLRLNIIVNCHVKEMMKGPNTIAASGETARTLPKYFNEFLYLYKNPDGSFKIRASGNSDFLASSFRTDVPPTGVLKNDDFDAYSQYLIRKDLK